MLYATKNNRVLYKKHNIQQQNITYIYVKMLYMQTKKTG